MKRHNLIITTLFTAFIGIMAILTAVLPKQEISVNEKRALAKFPAFSLQKLFSGKWESDFESYIQDHFPAREAFAATDAYFMLATGRNGSNGVYKGKDGYLFQTPIKLTSSTKGVYQFVDNIDAIEKFAANTGIKTKMIIVPSSGYIEHDKLPQNHQTYRDGEIISSIKENIQNVELIDPTNEFIKFNNMGDYYYKTDHHWTSEGAYLAYRLWCEDEGIEPRREDDYTIEKTDDFYGTSYSKSALWLTKPDTIEAWEYPIDATVTIDNKDEYNSMFFKEHLTEPDKYPVFLDGNHAFLRIVNMGNPNGKKILLIKDSYAHCFAPFMAESCSQIDMVDLRYYLAPVSKMTEETDYDEVLVLYGISNLCETNDLSILE